LINICPHYSIRYSEMWNIEYCADCNEWLEDCCTDTDCECFYRPPSAIDENTEKKDGIDYDLY